MLPKHFSKLETFKVIQAVTDGVFQLITVTACITLKIVFMKHNL